MKARCFNCGQPIELDYYLNPTKGIRGVSTIAIGIMCKNCGIMATLVENPSTRDPKDKNKMKKVESIKETSKYIG